MYSDPIYEDENGNLAESGTLSASGIQMFAGNGTGITPDLKLWRNGRLIPLRDLCSAYGDLLDAGWSMHPLKSNKHGVYLVQAEGPNGEQTTKLVVPFDLKDNLTATGVDDVSRTADKTDPGWQEDFWIMAPSGKTAAVPPATQGDDCENDTHFFIPLQGGYTHFRITPVDCSITSQNPFPLSAQDNKNFSTWPLVTWHGTTATTTEPDTSGFWSIGNSGTSSWQDSKLPVKVKVMKRRTVKVVVHYITGLTTLSSGNIQLRPPTSKPSSTKIKEKLYEIFTRQINTWFVNLECVDHEMAWDIGQDPDWGTNQSPVTGTAISPFNRELNLGGPVETENPESIEEEILLNARSVNADIDVFVIGGCWDIQTFVGINVVAARLSDFPRSGVAKRERSAVYVAGEMPISTNPVQEDLLLHAIAHEIGHIFIGSGHPDDDSDNGIHAGVAPLAGTQKIERLMFSDGSAKKTGGVLDRNLIVKKEWDEAEKWLEANPDIRFRLKNNLPDDTQTENY